MSGWRAALRVARRETWRARGRSVLVVTMIAVPVAALTFALVGYDTFTLTPKERADRLMGTAQALVAWPVDGPVFQFPTEINGLLPPQDGPGGDRPAERNPTLERLLPLLPAGATAIPSESGRLSVRTATGTGSVAARMLDYTDPLARGIYRPLSGRAPTAPDEVALTPDAVHRLGVGVGGTVHLSDGTRSFRVVATVEDPGDLSATIIVLRSGALPAGTLAADRSELSWLVDTAAPLTWAAVTGLNEHGVTAVSRYVLAHPPDPSELAFRGSDDGDRELAILVLVAGLAVLEIVLLAGPAFAVGARRRQRELALVAAVGGTPAHVRRIVLADGLVLGAVAAAVGTAVGVGAAVATHGLFENLGDERSGAFRVFPTALAIVAGLAVVTGLLAALVPAWISSRQNVVSALAGRRGITRTRRRWPLVGAGLGALGAAVAAAGAWRIDATVILTGLVIAELGLVLATPAIVALVARLGRRLPLAPRIALRDTSRNRTSAAPAVSAVMAAVVGSIAAGVVLGGILAREAAERDSSLSRPGDVFLFAGGKGGNGPGVPSDVVDTLRGILPVAAVHELNRASCATEFCWVSVRPPDGRGCPYTRDLLHREPTAAEQRAARRDARCDGVGEPHTYAGGVGSDNGMTLIVDPAAAGTVARLTAADGETVAAALRAGRVVVNNDRYVENDRVTLNVRSRGAGPGQRADLSEPRTVTVPVAVLPHPIDAPLTLMTPATAQSLGLGPDLIGLLATTSRVPTLAEQDRAEAALGGRYFVHVERANTSDNLFLTVLAIVAGVIALGAAAAATGLAAADSRADLGTLAAVGASPGVRRMLSLSQAGVIAGLGSLLGVIAGLGASTAVLFALNRRFVDVWPAPDLYPIRVPWLNVGVALVAVPLLAMLGAGLFTRSRLPIERRR